ncbi:MAG: hypothetical protein HY049_15590 [Acidobacteria bacterium]|nr:hypothetical protein [Acidobacteriota bacterium]
MKLVIEDADIVAWAPINNCFTFRKTPACRLDRDFWNGILIQLGASTRPSFWPDDPPHKGNGGPYHNFFGSIRFQRADESPVLIRVGGFKWINIVPVNDGRNDPVKSEDLVHGNTLPESLMVTLYPKFKPFAAITYWHDRKGYDLQVTEHLTGRGRVQVRHEFTFNQDVSIDIDGKRLDGRDEVSRISKITLSSIREKGGPSGGGIDPPPPKP